MIMNIFILFGHPQSMMDAVLAIIFDACKQFAENTSSSRINLIRRLF